MARSSAMDAATGWSCMEDCGAPLPLLQADQQPCGTLCAQMADGKWRLKMGQSCQPACPHLLFIAQSVHASRRA